MGKFLVIAMGIVLILSSLLLTPTINGDAAEYLGMAISIKNHLTPDFREKDAIERAPIVLTASNRKNWTSVGEKKSRYVNYFMNNQNKWYGYHFWVYSAICAIFLPIFNFLRLDVLKAFQFVNALLLISLFWWIWYKTTLSDKTKYYLTGITFISPIWFYFKWIHTEIFTYVLVYIALLEFLEQRIIMACLISSIAATQNAGATMIPFFILIVNLVKKKKIDKELIIGGLVSLICLLPYLYSYLNFGEPSLIAKYTTDIHSATLSKILTLFFDLNFGLIIYIPVLLLGFVYACFKKDKFALVSVLLLLAIGFVDATQTNWSSDMKFVQRYAFWMIPIIILSTIKVVEAMDWKKLKVALTAYLVTTGFWLIYALDSATCYYLNYQPVASLVLNVAPELYNPSYDVFYEKTTHADVSCTTKINGIFPLDYKYGDKVRKTLTYDEKNNKYSYINGKVDFRNIAIKPIEIKHKGYVYSLSGFRLVKTKRI